MQVNTPLSSSSADDDKTLKYTGVDSDSRQSPIVGDEDCTASVTSNDRTITITSGTAVDDDMPTVSAGDTVFVLKGQLYRVLNNVAESGGEARIFVVERDGKEYALKLYYAGYHFKEDLLRIVWNMHFEMVMCVYDYGRTVWAGEERDYELMELLQGGTLRDMDIDSDENKFRRIALQAAAALAYCHANRIIHKDIKPGNFFFRDKEKTELVLGDFGISTLYENEAMTVRTTQARTPAYAAPEMYDDVIDGEVEIGPRVDYYSLGITLLTLWLGRNPFSKNERMMMRMKQEGKIPYVSELPPRVQQIIKGLTALNPDKRWTFDEVERWYKGEEVPVDTSSAFLRYRSFVVDPERNLLAHDLQELVPLLFDNKELGVRYLYSHRISNWLEECGNAKMSVLLSDIVENRYPRHQQAGLMSAIYTMDPKFPYFDMRGNACNSLHDVAVSLYSNPEEYQVLLTDPYHTLFLYIEAHVMTDMERLRGYFKPGTDTSKGVWKLAFEIEPGQPFLLRAPSSTVSEIVRAFGDAASRSADDWLAVIDGRLLSWLNVHCDVAVCESTRILMEQDAYDARTKAYNILYNIDRSAAFDLREARTEARVADIMAAKLAECQGMDDEALRVAMADFVAPNGRLAIYARLHQWTDTVYNMEHFLDLTSKENRERFSIYTLHTALYKLCCAMGGHPYYSFDDPSCCVNTVEELQQLEPKVVRAAIRNGALTKWLSVFFHEDPHVQFESEADYERCVESYLRTLGSYDSGEVHYKRFVMAAEQLQQKIRDSRDAWNKAMQRKRMWMIIFGVLSAVWMWLLLFHGFGRVDIIGEYAYQVVCPPVSLAAAVMLFAYSYFRGGGGMFNMLWALGGIASSFIPALIINLGWVLWHEAAVRPLIVFLSIVYIAFAFIFSLTHKNSHIEHLRQVFTVDHDKMLRERLFYTFKTRSFKFRGSNYGLLDSAVGEAESLSSERVINYSLWSLMLVVLIIFFVIFHPDFFNYPVPDVAHMGQTIKNFFR